MLQKLKQKIRLWQWIAISVALTIMLDIIAHSQLGVLLLKATNISIALVFAYWADRLMFPYARPHQLKKDAWIETTTHTFKSEKCEPVWRAYSLAMIRRAIIVAAVVIAFALGL